MTAVERVRALGYTAEEKGELLLVATGFHQGYIMQTSVLEAHTEDALRELVEQVKQR